MSNLLFPLCCRLSSGSGVARGLLPSTSLRPSIPSGATARCRSSRLPATPNVAPGLPSPAPRRVSRLHGRRRGGSSNGLCVFGVPATSATTPEDGLQSGGGNKDDNGYLGVVASHAKRRRDDIERRRGEERRDGEVGVPASSAKRGDKGCRPQHHGHRQRLCYGGGQTYGAANHQARLEALLETRLILGVIWSRVTATRLC